MHNKPQDKPQKYRFNRDRKLIEAESLVVPGGPGEIFHVEAMIGDCLIRCGGQLVYPTVYVVSDQFTHLILGGLTSLEGPNSTSAKVALLSSFEDKVEACRRNGVSIHEKGWPRASFLPRAVSGDLGEEYPGVSESLRLITFHPKYRGALRSNIETFYRDLDRALHPHRVVPRYTEQRQEPVTAIPLTPSEFNTMFALTVAKHNRCIPRNQCAGLAENHVGSPSSHRHLCADRNVPLVDVLRLHLLPLVKTARLIREGLWVSVKGIGHLYYCPPPASRLPDPDNRPRVYFDPRSVDTVWIHVGYYCPPIACSLSARSKMYQGMSWAEVRLTQRRDRRMTQECEQNSRRPNMNG